MTSGNLQKKVTSDEYVPSAPPICSPAAEIKEVDGRIPASRAANMQSMAEDIGLSTKVDINISSGITHQVKVPNHSDSSVSFVHDLVTKPKAISFTGALVPFFFESTILPEFRFKSAYTCFRTTVAESGGRQVLFRLAFQLFMPSALGPWHRVLAYDARVRLCLHAWARGCVEASMFENKPGTGGGGGGVLGSSELGTHGGVPGSSEPGTEGGGHGIERTWDRVGGGPVLERAWDRSIKYYLKIPLIDVALSS
ncbi:hypothetical protein BC332_04602 [Capsicum chinense]|nr:hypothetical protein BC332_04602 [Capsicum chinense]